MKISIIRKEDQKISKWSGGTTKEVYIYPKASSYNERTFKFRVSSALIEDSESEFTYLKGVKRFITSLDNNLTLIHDENEVVKLRPYEVHEFLGDIQTKSIGKVKDFNLMLNNGINGEMQSLIVDQDYVLKNNSLNDEIYIFYSDEADMDIKVNKRNVTLLKEDCLVIETEKGELVEFMLEKQEKYTNILICGIRI